jgi:hypothetical protein
LRRSAERGLGPGGLGPPAAGEDWVDAGDHLILPLAVERGRDLEGDAGREETVASCDDDGARRICPQLLERGLRLLEQPQMDRVRRQPDDAHEE